MLRAVLAECAAMDLIRADGDRIALHPDLPEHATDRRHGDANFRTTLLELFVVRNERNHDLLRLIAWYLARPITNAPRDWKEFQDALDQQVGDHRLGMRNNLFYGQFNDWVTYLGFAWNHAHKGKEALMPDPTGYLRSCLPRLFGAVGTRLPAARIEAELARLCPVFEGGSIRNEVERLAGARLPGREPRVFSTATAHAWLCLQEEGFVEIEGGGADAEVYLLPDGERMVRCSAIRLRAAAQGN